MGRLMNNNDETRTAPRDERASLAPTTFAELTRFAEMAAKSDLVGRDYKGRPGNILLAVQMGSELGIAPMQSLQNICVIGGRASVWGDAVLAIVKARRDCMGVMEVHDEDTRTATCTARRKGHPDVVRTFSEADAKTAGLWGKAGPWTQYPKRMMQMRARSFACRDQWPDALRGLLTAEEATDIIVDARGPLKAAESPPPKTPPPKPPPPPIRFLKESQTSRKPAIDAKGSPSDALRQVMQSIAAAPTHAALGAVAPLAKELDVSEQDAARIAFRKRAADLDVISQPPRDDIKSSTEPSAHVHYRMHNDDEL